MLARTVTPPPRHPAIRRDLALVAPEAVPVAGLGEVMARAGAPLLESAALFDIYRGKQVQAGTRSLAWRLAFRAPDRTLTEAEADAALARIVAAAGTECGATLRAI